jgi:gluconate kinase
MSKKLSSRRWMSKKKRVRNQYPNMDYGSIFTSNDRRSVLEGTYAAAAATVRGTDQLIVACTAANRSKKASALLQCFQCRKWRTI